MIVWIFRELRSGSTALTDLICNHLNREHLFVHYEQDRSNVLGIPNPNDYLFSTHSFNFLEIMDTYSDPVLLIRCTRKNKAEQCLSHLLAKWMNSQVADKDRFWNIKRNENLNNSVHTFSQASPTIITKKQVMEYVGYLRDMEEQWDRIAKRHKNITLFYEDLCTGAVDIPELGIKSLSINTEKSSTVKMPPYKESLCINHQMVSNWIEEMYCPGGGMVDTQR